MSNLTSFRTPFALSALLLLTALARPAAALEVSLEENRADRGNIGFVDLKAVFRAFPETQKAQQSYAEIVRQAEEKVNLKKAELMALRAEIAALKTERKLHADSPVPPVPVLPPAPAPAPAAIVEIPAEPPVPTPSPESPGLQTAASAAAPVEGAPVPESLEELSGLPGMIPLAVKVSTPAAPPRAAPVVIDIPGMTEEPGRAAPPPAGGLNAEEAKAAAVRYAELVRLRAEALRAQNDALLLLDAKISSKTAELSGLESGFLEYQGSVEKNLINIENKRSEMLLGNIYRAIRRVAGQSGVSVVVDKSQILFGQGSVDLTSKVIKELEGAPL